MLAGARDWKFDHAMANVERRIALKPSPERAAAAVTIGLDDRMPHARLPHLAQLLAQAQPANVLLSLLADLAPGTPATELGACLLHEMVLRGVSVDPVAARWTTRLAGHPLGALPLAPQPGEDDLSLPNFQLNGASMDMPYGPGPAEVTAAGPVPSVERQPTPPDVTAAVTTWLTRSNGRAEAALFTLATPIDDIGVRTLESLGLDCLAGDGLALRRSTLSEVVALLFAAAAAGGAYDHGLGGAYGRAATWRSVTALSDGDPTGCTWWTFDAANDWFARVAWDIGIVCLRRNGRELAVLAATDVD